MFGNVPTPCALTKAARRVPSESQKSNAKIAAVTHAVVDRDVETSSGSPWSDRFSACLPGESSESREGSRDLPEKSESAPYLIAMQRDRELRMDKTMPHRCKSTQRRPL